MNRWCFEKMVGAASVTLTATSTARTPITLHGTLSDMTVPVRSSVISSYRTTDCSFFVSVFVGEC